MSFLFGRIGDKSQVLHEIVGGSRRESGTTREYEKVLFHTGTWKASHSRSFFGIFLHLESKDATISDMAASSSPAEVHKTSRYLLVVVVVLL